MIPSDVEGAIGILQIAEKWIAENGISKGEAIQIKGGRRVYSLDAALFYAHKHFLFTQTALDISRNFVAGLIGYRSVSGDCGADVHIERWNDQPVTSKDDCLRLILRARNALSNLLSDLKSGEG